MAKDNTTQTARAAAPANAESDFERDQRERKEGKTVEPREIGVNHVDLEATRDVVGERLEKLSADNEEGHAVNMEKMERAHEKNADVDLSSGGMADGENRLGGAAHGLGREDNGNTPRIDKHGNKSWHPPGVAGAAK
jgi:hypothetical protein